VQVAGTRGDVQQFVAVARELRRFGHRVRLATHAVYRALVEEHSVEFYPLAGEPCVFSEVVATARRGPTGAAPAAPAAQGDHADTAAASAAAPPLNHVRKLRVCPAWRAAHAPAVSVRTSACCHA
jgi:Glycosyltransferase family 28 N-terminal domain